MAYTKVNWQNLPNKSTPLSATNLNHMDDGIFNNDVNITNLTNQLKNFNDYSEGTRIIGSFGNKLVYRSVYIASAYAATYNTNIMNVDTVLKMTVAVQQTNSSGDWRNVPWLYASNTAFGNAEWAGGAYFIPKTGVLALQIGSSLQQFKKLVFVMEYTKTAD